nr:protein trichome birefringence-like 19 [Ziziphus jujuba var. spinosa]
MGKTSNNSKPPLISNDYEYSYYNLPSTSSSSSSSSPSSSTQHKCNIFSGKWVPNPEGPYYNKSCWAIHDHVNCMKYGRHDSEFMKWRWKPDGDGCELPIFNPAHFLELVKGKSLAFVGDSVARNHVQSLICLLSIVEYPIDVSKTPDFNFKRWRYTSYNFTMATFWTPYLVKRRVSDSGLASLYLDEFDEEWTTEIEEFDYIILSAGHWFFRRAVFYEKGNIVGCHYCIPDINNATELGMFYGYRNALRTAFKAITNSKDYKGITYLRTFSPSHFENGLWNEGGNCVRTKPFRRNETELEGDNMEVYKTQLEEFRNAEREGRERGLKFRLLDTTQAMLLRPDGHPNSHGRWRQENLTSYNDCLHWCLPGPIDTWNDFLLEMMKNELHLRSAEEETDKNLHSND